jgi:hypothetical protein
MVVVCRETQSGVSHLRINWQVRSAADPLSGLLVEFPDQLLPTAYSGMYDFVRAHHFIVFML